MIAAEAEKPKCYEFYEATVKKISSVDGVVIVNIKFTVDNVEWSDIPLNCRKECNDFTRREFKATNEYMWGVHADEPRTFIGGRIGGSNKNGTSLSSTELRERAALAAERRSSLNHTSSSSVIQMPGSPSTETKTHVKEEERVCSAAKLTPPIIKSFTANQHHFLDLDFDFDLWAL